MYSYSDRPYTLPSLLVALYIEHICSLCSLVKRSVFPADAELPPKAGLMDRRAKYDAVKAQQAAQLAALEAEDAARKRPREEDEVYLEARAQADVRTDPLLLHVSWRKSFRMHTRAPTAATCLCPSRNRASSVAMLDMS